MTRDQAKKAIELLQAYIDGKTIEYKIRGIDYNWCQFKKNDNPAFDWSTTDYRIKPEPTYRPYNSMQEFMEAEKKHGPWLLRDCDHSIAYKALHVSDQAVSFLNYHKSFEDLFNDFEWQDGTGCCVMEGGEK